MSTTEKEIVGSPAVQAPVSNPSILDPRVERGAAFLDEKEPGWEHRIDLDAFRLVSPCNCICGQFGAGNYADGARHLGYPDSIDHGFFCANADDYGPLDQDWRLAILARRIDPVSAHTDDLWSSPKLSPESSSEASDG